MSKAKIDLNSRGLEQVLRSSEVEKEIKRRADNVARAAGPGMRVAVVQGTDRVRGTVWTGTQQAKRAEADNRSLTRAIDAGRQ